MLGEVTPLLPITLSLALAWEPKVFFFSLVHFVHAAMDFLQLKKYLVFFLLKIY